MAGYLTPAVDSDSGSEYCPSDGPGKKQKQQTKKGKKGKKNTQDTNKTPQVPCQAPSPPETGSPSAPVFFPGLEQQVGQNNQQFSASGFPILPFKQFSYPVPMNIPSNNQQLQQNAFMNQQGGLLPAIQNQELQENAVENQQSLLPAISNQQLQDDAFKNQQSLLPPNNNTQCIQPSLLRDLSHSNRGSGIFMYQGVAYPQFDFEAEKKEGKNIPIPQQIPMHTPP